MRYRRLGKTDLQVSELSLGGLFTSQLRPGVSEAKRAVHRAVERGVNLIDTAPAYADSEEVLGSILRDIDTPLIVCTKLGGRPQPFHPHDADQLRMSVEHSLQLLHRDVIDVLLVHEPDRPGQYDWWTDPSTTYGPVIDALDLLRRDGLIRFTGLGGTTVSELTHHVNSDRFDVVLTAFNYSALFREAAAEVIPAAQHRDMGILLGSVLQQGALGRRFDDVVRSKPAWLSRARQQQLLALYQVLDQTGISIVEMGLRFAISADLDGSVLVGAKTEQQIDAAIDAVEKGPLPDDILKKLDDLANMVPYRPFEEPMILPLQRPGEYHGPGPANVGAGHKVGSRS